MNLVGGIILAAFSGGLYFTTDHKFMAIICLIFAWLFSIGYFNLEDNEKSVMQPASKHNTRSNVS